ncbi:hypothetical protein D3C72_2543390 [compost metagenome]
MSCGGNGATFATLADLPVSELKLSQDLLDGVAFDPFVQQLVAGIVNLAKRPRHARGGHRCQPAG